MCVLVFGDAFGDGGRDGVGDGGRGVVGDGGRNNVMAN